MAILRQALPRQLWWRIGKSNAQPQPQLLLYQNSREQQQPHSVSGSKQAREQCLRRQIVL